MEPLISIIIPVYNLESYVQACLDSVCAQTYPHWEAVCVDDGSRDGSLSVLRAAQEKDARIRALHRENAGVSAARNFGMAQAKGDFLFFLDGDDILHPQALEHLMRGMQSGAYDIVISDFQRITDTHFLFPTIEQTTCVPLDLASYFQKAPITVRSACAKLYRREVAMRAQFPTSFVCAEDTHFLFQIFSANVRLGYVDAPLYGYLERVGSATMRADVKKNITSLTALSESCAMLQKEGNAFLFGMAMEMLLKEAFSYRMLLADDREAVRFCREKCRVYLRHWLRCGAIPLRTRLLFYALYRCPILYKMGRIRTDPTLKDYFKQKKKAKGEPV